MNYKKLYNQIVTRAKTREIEGYSETHHILPKSLGGTNSKCNLVKLTAREHFICHYLLTKIYSEGIEHYKMLCAFNTMAKRHSKSQQRYYNSRLYEASRKKFSEAMSILTSGEKNSHYGKVWIYNENTNESVRISKEDKIPEGWRKGRAISRRRIVKCKVCNKMFDRRNTNKSCCSDECVSSIRSKPKQKSIERALDSWYRFQDSDYTSAAEFCRDQTTYNSHQHMFRDWKLYVPEYKQTHR